jgi:hypothetical protein
MLAALCVLAYLQLNIDINEIDDTIHTYVLSLIFLMGRIK